MSSKKALILVVVGLLAMSQTMFCMQEQQTTQQDWPTKTNDCEFGQLIANLPMRLHGVIVSYIQSDEVKRALLGRKNIRDGIFSCSDVELRLGIADANNSIKSKDVVAFITFVQMLGQPYTSSHRSGIINPNMQLNIFFCLVPVTDKHIEQLQGQRNIHSIDFCSCPQITGKFLTSGPCFYELSFTGCPIKEDNFPTNKPGLCKSLKKLTITIPTFTAKCLKSFPSIEIFRILNEEKTTNFDFMSLMDLENLRELCFSEIQFSTPLHVKNLQKLELFKCVFDVTFLSNLEKLKELNLLFCPEVNIESLTLPENLEHLKISSNQEYTVDIANKLIMRLKHPENFTFRIEARESLADALIYTLIIQPEKGLTAQK